jgi:nitroimidazol reductase NimA-like FMN-containing flavoprotein (pyridoxamine 5'-phosphate oxidase superfamily)
MRRKEKEITDIEEIEQVIKKAKVCRLGLVDNDGAYIVPVCFGYDRNNLYFHSAPEGRKMELIKKNKRVCFEIDTDVEIVNAEKPCGWTTKYRSVIGTGRAYILEKDEEKVHGLSLIMRQYSEGKPSLDFEKLDSVLVVKIDIESMTGKKSGY